MIVPSRFEWPVLFGLLPLAHRREGNAARGAGCDCLSKMATHPFDPEETVRFSGPPSAVQRLEPVRSATPQASLGHGRKYILVRQWASKGLHDPETGPLVLRATPLALASRFRNSQYNCNHLKRIPSV